MVLVVPPGFGDAHRAVAPVDCKQRQPYRALLPVIVSSLPLSGVLALGRCHVTYLILMPRFGDTWTSNASTADIAGSLVRLQQSTDVGRDAPTPDDD